MNAAQLPGKEHLRVTRTESGELFIVSESQKSEDWRPDPDTDFVFSYHKLLVPYHDGSGIVGLETYMFVLPVMLMGIPFNIAVFYFYRYVSPVSLFAFFAQYISFTNIVGLILLLLVEIVIQATRVEGRFNFACGAKIYISLVLFMVVGLQLVLIAIERWRRIVHSSWSQFNIKVCRSISYLITVAAVIVSLPSYLLYQPRDMYYTKPGGEGMFHYIRILQCLPGKMEEEWQLMTIYVGSVAVAFFAIIIVCAFVYTGIVINKLFGPGPVKGTTQSSKVAYNSAWLFLILTIVFLGCHGVSFVRSVLIMRFKGDEPFGTLQDKVIYGALRHSNLLAYVAPLAVFSAWSTRFRMECRKWVRTSYRRTVEESKAMGRKCKDLCQRCMASRKGLKAKEEPPDDQPQGETMFASTDAPHRRSILKKYSSDIGATPPKPPLGFRLTVFDAVGQGIHDETPRGAPGKQERDQLKAADLKASQESPPAEGSPTGQDGDVENSCGFVGSEDSGKEGDGQETTKRRRLPNQSSQSSGCDQGPKSPRDSNVQSPQDSEHAKTSGDSSVLADDSVTQKAKETLQDEEDEPVVQEEEKEGGWTTVTKISAKDESSDDGTDD